MRHHVCITYQKQYPSGTYTGYMLIAFDEHSMDDIIEEINKSCERSMGIPSDREPVILSMSELSEELFHTLCHKSEKKDKRLELIEEVIALNNKEIARMNKTASESRQKMNITDRKKLSSLKFINDDLGKIKFKIVQNLVVTSDGINIKIIGEEKLNERIEEYKAMFPETYLTLEKVKEALWDDYKRNGGNTGLFGLSVSPEWEDKCYSFEFRGDDDEISYEFMGMYKC